ncbi:MAG: pilus assembly protein [Anaerolineae bacterium]|nr:pilus assembly protein [Anaerolineae bacterium]
MKTTTRTPKTQGQALVEFALTLPILLLFVFGIIDLARALFIYSQLIDAARQTVRYGITVGLEANNLRYLDCEGLRQTAHSMPGVYNLQDATISIHYEDAAGNILLNPSTGRPISCEDDLTWWDVNNGDVLVVSIQGQIRSITPYFTNLFALTLSHTSRRTIVSEGTPYTDQWPAQPETAQGFEARVRCDVTDAGGLNSPVSFSWTPLSVGSRAEIREALTNTVVKVLSPTEAWAGQCTSCATIPQSDGVAMYYLVAVTGANPNELAGPPSDFSSVSCGGGTEALVSAINGTVWQDVNSDGIQQTSTDKSYSSVYVTMVYAGADGALDTGDDQADYRRTDNQGSFSFSNLGAGLYRVTVSGTATTGNSPLELHLPGGQTHTYSVGLGDGSALASAPMAASDSIMTSTETISQITTLSALVWLDGGADGNYQNATKDPGVPAGTAVDLTWTGPDGSTQSFSATTDSNGRFSLSDLPAGAYQVAVHFAPYSILPGQDTFTISNNQATYDLSVGLGLGS